jgi:hypothetical protein
MLTPAPELSRVIPSTGMDDLVLTSGTSTAFTVDYAVPVGLMVVVLVLVLPLLLLLLLLLLLVLLT